MKRFAAFAATLSATGLMLAAPAQASRAESFRAPPVQPAKPWLRGLEPGTTGSIEGPTTAAAARPPCPPERKIGTGAGFCVIN
ncbi:hypothetical protein [Methylobacterium aerolatum]|uniref:Porin n=1 Tax=Methylobacterium aerolatum TaxID=418708 RepID=A0ABU0I1S7_9HYPH|nr:hypothetical protein [Methylobacterium aerolatum]MDQ0448545.1 hypothetical protein [Methylobacterium aerolatum]GJD33162.1 hypothetical protein FMGBMHLM_0047 [Methylobacterium aerolatum]